MSGGSVPGESLSIGTFTAQACLSRRKKSLRIILLLEFDKDFLYFALLLRARLCVRRALDSRCDDKVVIVTRTLIFIVKKKKETKRKRLT